MKKLNLTKETLVALNSQDAQNVNGGTNASKRPSGCGGVGGACGKPAFSAACIQ